MKIGKMLLQILLAAAAVVGLALLIVRAVQVISDVVEDQTAIDLDDSEYYEEGTSDGTAV